MRSSVDVGSYSLEVGSPGGTAVRRLDDPAQEGSESLERVLATGGPRREEGASAAGVVDDAAAVTAKIERAVALGKGAAEGKALSPDLLGLEIVTLLDLLERLDREKRHKEELLLARALVNLLMLLRRWAELLRALRAALRAGAVLGDPEAIGWAKHELGTLRIVTGDVEGAERALHEARQARERIGDRQGIAATNRNLQVLCGRLREMLRTEELVRAKDRRGSGLRVASLATLFTLLFGVGVAVGVVADDSGETPASRVDNRAGSSVRSDAGPRRPIDTAEANVPVSEPDSGDIPVTEPAGAIDERDLSDEDGPEVSTAPSEPPEEIVK